MNQLFKSDDKLGLVTSAEGFDFLFKKNKTTSQMVWAQEYVYVSVSYIRIRSQWQHRIDFYLITKFMSVKKS